MFNSDLEQWKKTEREFASRLLKREIADIQFSQGMFKDWDVRVWFVKNWWVERKTFEIKNDLVSDRTGNVGFEYLFNNKPSWIYTSTADYIVYKLGDKFYYADRLKLLIWLAKVEKQDVEWWDKNLSRMFLVKKDVFNWFAKVI